MPTGSHQLTLILLPTTINARYYSFFVHVYRFVWNQVPLNILGTDRHSAFHHNAYI